MDALIHTWDLATPTGQDATLDPHLVGADGLATQRVPTPAELRR
jgi:hypothetical protein